MNEERVTDRVGLADLADGAGQLQLDASGRVTNPLVLVDLDHADWALADEAAGALGPRTPVIVGLSSRPVPEAATALLEAFTVTLAPGGPGSTWVDGGQQTVEAIAATVAASPVASVTMAGLLPLTARSDVRDGLAVESLAYSALLGGSEFAAWRKGRVRGQVPEGDEPVLLTREGDVLSVVLNRPDRRNAFGRAVRDGLIAAIEVAESDPSIRSVTLSGNGPSFCSGGDLDEFGSATDLASAHLVRVQQSAGLSLHRIADRVRVVVHGACVGAGIEVPAFASRVEAREGAWFLLPELSMGLVPGAGGTVSISRRIGRWRTAYMALLGEPIDLDTALAWGLVDARV
jgi:hypothetical protein